MRQLGIEAIYPQPRLSPAHPEYQVYAYLLRGLAITAANQVWLLDLLGNKTDIGRAYSSHPPSVYATSVTSK